MLNVMIFVLQRGLVVRAYFHSILSDLKYVLTCSRAFDDEVVWLHKKTSCDELSKFHSSSSWTKAIRQPAIRPVLCI